MSHRTFGPPLPPTPAGRTAWPFLENMTWVSENPRWILKKTEVDFLVSFPVRRWRDAATAGCLPRTHPGEAEAGAQSLDRESVPGLRELETFHAFLYIFPKFSSEHVVSFQFLSCKRACYLKNITGVRCFIKDLNC